MDVLAVETAAQRAVAHVRRGDGPYFLELRTYRFRAHSMSDPELYRSKEEVEQWRSAIRFDASLPACGPRACSTKRGFEGAGSTTSTTMSTGR